MIVSAEEQRKAQAFLGPPSVTATIGPDGVRCTDPNGHDVHCVNGEYIRVEPQTKPGEEEALRLSEFGEW